VGEEQVRALTLDETESEELDEKPVSFPEIVEELTSGKSRAFLLQPKVKNTSA
jgi:hypothetical protein